MGSLRHDDVALFLRRAGDAARQSGTADGATARATPRERRPSGIYPKEAPSPSDRQGDEESKLARAMEELRAKQAQLELACELLERERAKYIDLFEHSPDASITTDTAGSITDANVAAGALFGVDAGALAGKPLISFVARQDTRKFRAQLRNLTDASRVHSMASMALRMRPRGGQVFAVTLCARVVRGVRGNPMALRCTLRRTDAPASPPATMSGACTGPAKETQNAD